MSFRQSTPSRVRRARIYRKAAEKALVEGMGYQYLRTRVANPWHPFDWIGYDEGSSEQRCIALCLIAAMVEAGDA